MRVIDGDSHFMEPLDLYVRYIDPAFRERAMRIDNDAASGDATIVVDGRPLKMINANDLLAAVVAYGQKEAGQAVSDFDRYLALSPDWQNMDKRVAFLDAEGIQAQVLYPTLGLLWEGTVSDPVFADALCRAYNTWAFELCSGHNDRLFPAAHISLRDADLAVRELGRVAKLGCRSIFVAAAPVNGHSFGHPDLDPIWAAVQDLDLSVGIHLTGHRHSTGRQWYRDRDPGMMFVTMNLIQDPRMGAYHHGLRRGPGALSTPAGGHHRGHGRLDRGVAGAARLSLQIYGPYLADETPGLGVLCPQHLDQRRSRREDVPLYRRVCRRRKVFCRLRLSARRGLCRAGQEGARDLGVPAQRVGGQDSGRQCRSIFWDLE